MQGRRVVFTAPGKVELESYDVPDPGPSCILVETLVSVISPGTERANFLRHFNTATFQDGFPFAPGYSNVGRVVALGSKVTGVAIGDMVATMSPHQSHCVVRAPVADPVATEAWPPEADITSASWFLPPNAGAAELKHYATFIIVMVGLYGVMRGSVSLADRVVIMGLGPVGLAAGQFSRVSGALPVMGVSRSGYRRQMALNAGFDIAVAPGDELHAALSQANWPTVVIEATGEPQNVLAALKACPVGARLVLLGSTRGTVDRVDFYSLVHRKALTIIGSHQPTRPSSSSLERRRWQYRDGGTVIAMIAAGRIDAAPLLSHEYAVDELEEAYRTLSGRTDAQGIVLKWA